MNLHVRPEEPPLSEERQVVLGMPHLCPAGLSENWLWKELGHSHWGLIARGFGRAAAGFGAEGSAPVYAAFRAIALRDGDLGAAAENQALELRSALIQLSGTRVVSRHRASLAGRTVAEVDMTSVFVRREAAGVNRSIVRVRLDGGVGPARPSVPAAARPGPGAGLPREGERELGTVVVEPCPHLEFNGAGLLYFSSFVAAVDRAEWRLLGARTPLLATRDRQAVFHGNVEVGEALAVRLLVGPEGAGARHRALVSAVSDGRLLAEVETRRIAVPAA